MSDTTLFPYFVYRDGNAALRFLADAFGFEATQSFPSPDGSLMHAEMKLGASYIMLGTASAEQAAQQPWNLPQGRGIYVWVEDVDAHCARARAAGAKIVMGPESTEWGSRRYRALDLDGYEWSFGNYRPAGS